MTRKKTLTMVMMIIVFIALILYDYRLHKELKVKINNLNSINQYKRQTKNIGKKEKVEYSYVLKEIQTVKTLEIDEMLVEKNDKNHSVKLRLLYIKPLEEFIIDEEIKEIFTKNKNFNIKSVILKENKVIISMECVLS